ncbi:MAG: hypothetical protein GY788_23505 [bacterium]|nr:hypothetical protein [bacterium]
MFRIVQTEPPAEQPVMLDEVKAHVNVTHADDDVLLTAFLNGAIAHLDGMAGVLGRCLVSQKWRLDLGGWPAYRTVRFPFPDVTAVVVKYFDDTNTEQTVSAADFEILEDETGGFICLASDFSKPNLYTDREDPVQIEFTAGFADAVSVPEPIKTAIKMLVARWHIHRGDGDLDSIPMGVKALIAPYRRVSF